MVELIARRVVELLRAEPVVAPGAPRMLSAAEVAARIGRSRDFVYDHAADLGALRLGDGPRARLSFDAEVVEEWVTRRRPSGRSNRPRSKTGTKQGRQPATSGSGVDLLPITRSTPDLSDKKRPGGAPTPPARHQEVEP